ncbi:hypothetical protein HQ47_06990 [Porphyromonas macacae]|uniref:Uncharacterized protein n=1 Tax=Porphyromonas macacae TaxID=28115 RepID=A0A0A2E7Q6_9PORP|nr:hypothetical protein [Porphyromonas macacae]KGN73687.1 hypothetical protein HQ47_06990 [Porphyromonas macacae]
MINIFKYMYYRLFTWNLKKWGRYDGPEWNALLGVSFMVFLNVYTFVFLLELLGYINFLRGNFRRPVILILGFSILGMNYLLLTNKGKYLQLVKHYKKESKAERRKNSFILWGYAVISVLLPFLMISIHKQLVG